MTRPLAWVTGANRGIGRGISAALAARGFDITGTDLAENEDTAVTRKMVEVFRPFDYGRYEFRLDLEKGDVQMLEVNLNCNLWSEKVYGRSAKAAGWTQEQLIETILCESLRRHGLLEG